MISVESEGICKRVPLLSSDFGKSRCWAMLTTLPVRARFTLSFVYAAGPTSIIV